MNDRWEGLGSADAVRRRNEDLDRQLLGLFDAAPGERIHESFGDEWTVARNLAHIAEFPRYFARQLREWIAGDRVVVGRVAEWDADRNDAIVQADQQELGTLRRAASDSFETMADALESLDDAHLEAPTHNVKYGQEPLTAFLDRYVVGHKVAHVSQLREALERLTSAP